MNRRRTAGIAVTAIGFLAIAVATLTPVGGTFESQGVWCITCGSLALADAIVNIVLFIPAGVGLGLLARRIPPALFALTLTSVAIEVIQAWAVPGRDSSLRDVITNTLGGGVGIAMAKQWRWWLVPPAGVATRLAIVAWGVWAVTLGTTSALTRPSIIPGPYWGQRGGDDGFGTHVVSVAVNDMSVPLGPLADPRAVLAALRSGTVSVEVAVSPDAPYRTGAIARLSNPGTEAFRLAQRGRDFTFSIRLRSADVRLRSPVVRLPDAVPGTAGAPPATSAPSPDALRIQAGLRHGILWLTRGQHDARLALSPTVGWAFFAPIGIAARTPPWALAGLWIAFLCIPIGYWAVACRQPTVPTTSRPSRLPDTVPARLVAVALIVALPLAVVPLIADTPWPTWYDWCFAMAGLWSGAVAARTVRAVLDVS